MKKKIIFAALAVVAVVVVCTIPGGCQFMVMDVPSALTSWLDFQEFPKEMEALYARDFTGKTKQEMLAEFLAVDGGRTNWAGRGRKWGQASTLVVVSARKSRRRASFPVARPPCMSRARFQTTPSC